MTVDRARLTQTALDALTLLVAVALLFPILWVMVASFRPEGDILAGALIPRTLTLEHYRAVLGEAAFVRALANSLIVGLASALIAVGVALPAAYALARFQFRGREQLGLLVLST